MKKVIAILTLAIGSTVAAHAAHPAMGGARTHASATHDRSPRPHVKAAVPHK